MEATPQLRCSQGHLNQCQFERKKSIQPQTPYVADVGADGSLRLWASGVGSSATPLMQGWELNPGLPACLVRNLSIELHPGALFHFFLRLFGIPTLGSASGSGRYPGQWSLVQGTALWLLACSETIFAFFSLLSVYVWGKGWGVLHPIKDWHSCSGIDRPLGGQG